jgi:hypothetical protein
MQRAAGGQEATVSLPRWITAGEAGLVLRMLARLKEQRFGRLAVSVSDGRVVDIEVVEKIDRSLFQSFSP